MRYFTLILLVINIYSCADNKPVCKPSKNVGVAIITEILCNNNMEIHIAYQENGVTKAREWTFHSNGNHKSLIIYQKDGIKKESEAYYYETNQLKWYAIYDNDGIALFKETCYNDKGNIENCTDSHKKI